MIENSEGSRIFNSLYVKEKDTGKEYDVLNDGEFSDAVFVSSLLTIFGFMDRPHSTVTTLISKLKENGFMEVKGSPKEGDVIVWEKIEFKEGSFNEHVGFYLDENRAISTDYKIKSISAHHPKGESRNRNIIAIYRSDKLRSI